MSTNAEDRSPGQVLCTSSGTPHDCEISTELFLPGSAARVRLARVTRPLRPRQGCRDLDPASSGRRSSAPGEDPEAIPGRSGGPGRAGPEAAHQLGQATFLNFPSWSFFELGVCRCATRRCPWCPAKIKPPRGVPIPSTAPCGQPAMCPGWSHGRTMRTTLAYEATSSSWSDGGARVDWGNREVIR